MPVKEVTGPPAKRRRTERPPSCVPAVAAFALPGPEDPVEYYAAQMLAASERRALVACSRVLLDVLGGQDAADDRRLLEDSVADIVGKLRKGRAHLSELSGGRYLARLLERASHFAVDTLLKCVWTHLYDCALVLARAFAPEFVAPHAAVGRLHGVTPLHLVDASTPPDFVRALSRLGFDVNVEDAAGATPLMRLLERPWERTDAELNQIVWNDYNHHSGRFEELMQNVYSCYALRLYGAEARADGGSARLALLVKTLLALGARVDAHYTNSEGVRLDLLAVGAATADLTTLAHLLRRAPPGRPRRDVVIRALGGRALYVHTDAVVCAAVLGRPEVVRELRASRLPPPDATVTVCRMRPRCERQHAVLDRLETAPLLRLLLLCRNEGARELARDLLKDERYVYPTVLHDACRFLNPEMVAEILRVLPRHVRHVDPATFALPSHSLFTGPRERPPDAGALAQDIVRQLAHAGARFDRPDGRGRYPSDLLVLREWESADGALLPMLVQCGAPRPRTDPRPGGPSNLDELAPAELHPPRVPSLEVLALRAVPENDPRRADVLRTLFRTEHNGWVT